MKPTPSKPQKQQHETLQPIEGIEPQPPTDTPEAHWERFKDATRKMVSTPRKLRLPRSHRARFGSTL